MSLLEWFKSRNEESAINKTLIHMQKVLECVVEFEKGLTFLIEEKNIDLALKVFFRVDELERQADYIRRDILNMLSKAELTPIIREHMTHLAKRIDDVANATNACSRILVYLNYNDFKKLDESIHKQLLEMTKISVESVKKLNLMVIKMLDGPEKEIKELGDVINTLEHKCDEIHFNINRNLSSNNYDINPFSAIEIWKMISNMEDITDAAEEVADYIVMLAIAQR